jgi:hypothetical protein
MSIQFDFSFVEETLSYLRSKNGKSLDSLIEHPAAQLVHAHYLFFHFSGEKLDRRELWNEILASLQKKEENYYLEVENVLSYLKENEAEFCRIAKEETLSCAPKAFELNSTIFMILGYDMGIAFNGDVAMNIGFSLYREKPIEMLYFAIHELSHVVVNSYQPALLFSSLKTRGDLFRVLQFHTQLEGLGVFTPLRIRKAKSAFSHIDYKVLQEVEMIESLKERFFNLLEEAEKYPSKEIEDEDWKPIIECSEDRMWYTIGCHMAQMIAEKLGLDELIKTIEEGYHSFFKKYQQSIALEEKNL